MITLTSKIERTPRVMQIEGMFDIDSVERATTEIPNNIPNLDERDWNVGLIVGPSGAGKTTVANNLFPDQMRAATSLEWSKDKALIDDFPKTMSIQEITTLLSSVGFSSPPSWLRPFNTLSNGEQFRVSMARLLAEQPELAVVDEFTSVVDRTVAQIGSHAIAKTIRKRNQKFVAVGCHYDIEEWLQPDWIFQPATGEFRWESPRQRPQVKLEFIRATPKAWNAFSRYHYLNHTLPSSAAVIVGLIDGKPAVLVATMFFPHPKVTQLYKISRIVVLPDYQGLGLGAIALDLVAGAFKAMGKKMNIVTSHPAFIKSLNRGGTWKMTRKPSRVGIAGATSTMSSSGSSRNRLTTTFSYVGEANNQLVPLYQQIIG
jgi:ABC-type lipoprotein export system ATPase subunit/GNAT superfamily N-acetyltransferase